MKYTQYKYSRNLSWEILLKEGIKELPIKIIPLCRQMGINVIKYSDAPQVIEENRDGCSVVIDGRMYILYDNSMPIRRQRFTIAHELGHILMNHVGIEEDETEANIFASRLLMPICVLHECGVTRVEEIMEMCYVSQQAAEIRLRRLNILRERNKFYLSPLERKVREQFSNYIKSIIKQK